MGKLVLTGAAGFVGKALLTELRNENWIVNAVVRSKMSELYDSGISIFEVGDFSQLQDWSNILKGVDVVIHLAARVHEMNDKSSDPMADFRKINVQCTLNLARQAAKSGVKRFIYLSTIKVNGESTKKGRPFFADDVPCPSDPYAISKYEAELGLQEIASKMDFDLVIIRAPLVYGPGVKANFLTMMNWLSLPIPLPLGAFKNSRSFIALDNLVDFIVKSITHPLAANQIFLVSDGENLSTPDLLYRLGYSLGRSPKLIAVPISWIEFFASLFGKKDFIRRLSDSLEVDIAKTHKLLGWKPPISVDEGLRRVGDDFLSKVK
jgi:UDP-glucose 4-epimerase